MYLQPGALLPRYLHSLRLLIDLLCIAQEDEISALRTQLASLQSQSTTTEPQARTNTSNNTPGGYNADHRALVHQHQRPSTRTRGFSTSTIPSTSTSTAFQPQPQPLPQLQLQLHQPQQTPLVASGLAHNPLPAPPEPVPDNRLPSFARSHTTPDVRSRSGERERHRHRDRHRSHGSGHRHVSGEARRGPRLTSDQQDPLRDQTSSSATRAPSGASSSAHAENTNTNHTPARTRPASMHVAPAYSSDSSQGHNTSSGSDPSAWFGGELPAWVTSSEVWRPHTEPMDENAVAESWAEWEAKHPHPPAVIDSDSEDDIVVLPARSLGADGDRAALSPNARNVPPGIRQGATSPSRKVVVDVSEALERRGRPRKQDNGPHAQQQELTREEQQQQQPSSQEFRPQAGYNSVPFDITILSIVGPNPNSNQHTVHWAPTPQQSLHGVSAIVPAPTPFADEEQLEQFDLLNGSEVRPHLSHDSPYHRGPVAIFAKGSDTLPRFHELMRDPTEERNAASTSTAHLNGLSNGQRRSSQDDSRLVQAAAFMSGFAEGEFEAQTQTQSERERDVLIGSTGRPAAMRVMPQPGQPQPMVNMSPASYASNATTTTVSLSTHSSWGEESTRSSHASSGATFDQFHLNALPTPELNGPAQIFSENQRTPMAFTRPLDTGGLLLVQGIAEPQPHRPVNNLSTSSTPSNSRSQNGVENTNGRRHASDGSHEAAARRRRSTSLSQTEESPVLQMQASYRRPALPTFDGFPNLQTSASDSVMQFQPFSPWPQGLEEGDMRTIRAPAPTSDEGARALRNWDLADH